MFHRVEEVAVDLWRRCLRVAVRDMNFVGGLDRERVSVVRLGLERDVAKECICDERVLERLGCCPALAWVELEDTSEKVKKGVAVLFTFMSRIFFYVSI